MRDSATFRIGLVMAAGAVLAGCAGTTGSSTATPTDSATAASSAPVLESSPSAPSTVPTSPAPTTVYTSPPASGLPTLTKPTKPPREPTDNLPSTGWVAGMVTRGGKGPCYGLVADDGTQYALYSTAGTELTKGDRVKVNLETTLLRIYCGPGKLMSMVEAQKIQ
ncbi:hypothetical protein AB0M02_37320 [Actinoplanes sp. NPDC051861]|uniref:hypothetical protein n=1 Tax=Actinoplanes sp. NPDC051861 TaxID=3155170 RepID=UPI00343B9D73